MKRRGLILRQCLRVLKSQWWSAEQIHAWREQAVVSMLRHAVTHVPHYRRLGIDPGSITSLADLQRFPLLTKRDLQADPQSFLADGLDSRTLHSSRTSGSTGEPTVTYFDDESWAFLKYALKIRRTLAVTSPLFHRCLIVSEQPPNEAGRYAQERPFGGRWLYRERVVSLYEDLSVHRAAIRELQPDMLYAFPSYLLELIASYRKAGEAAPQIPLLFTSSEVLTEEARARIESELGGRIFDIYGSTEFKEVAWQCRHGSYHVNFESVHVEALPDAAGTDRHVLVLTTVCNRAMPLIRFYTGDLGTLEAPHCPCGRRTPRLRILHGREGDVLELPSGRRLSPYTLTTLIEELPGLHQYRIRHDAPDRLTVELSASELNPERLEDCRRRILEMLREPLQISMQPVEQIPRGAGGKHKVFVRNW